MNSDFQNNVNIVFGDAINFYGHWPRPSVIISDGPYGVGSFPGDPPTPNALDEWYEKHVQAWYDYSLPAATLWFWNTEVGWANVHPVLEKYGWKFKGCNIWNKGIAHIAGNTNTKSISRFPPVTEVCAQYVKDVKLPSSDGDYYNLQDWLNREWKRTGMPFSKTNEVCGVKNAATRKYFTKDHLWYFPPVEAFEKIVEYANVKGPKQGKPYFSIDGKQSITKEEWATYKPKFYCPVGITNVWSEPAVRGQERLKNGYKAIHINQKPLKIMEMIVKASSDTGDTVWEPFGGLCSAGIAAAKLDRVSYCAEINKEYFEYAISRKNNGYQSFLFT